MNSPNCIRILELLPGKDDSPIQCTTRIAHLWYGEAYEAVSYVWGDGPPSRSVQISGEAVKITQTLYAALKRFRDPIDTRSIWVDQLCINQSDAKEKTHQVNMMREIYKQCTRCLIWLGEIPEASAGVTIMDAQAAFDFISALAGETVDSQQGSCTPLSLAMPDQVDGARRAFKALIFQGNPWWSRIWTVQEVVLPPEGLLKWGPLSLRWNTISKSSEQPMP
jgi:hypothetical protein